MQRARARENECREAEPIHRPWNNKCSLIMYDVMPDSFIIEIVSKECARERTLRIFKANTIFVKRNLWCLLTLFHSLSLSLATTILYCFSLCIHLCMGMCVCVFFSFGCVFVPFVYMITWHGTYAMWWVIFDRSQIRNSSFSSAPLLSLLLLLLLLFIEYICLSTNCCMNWVSYTRENGGQIGSKHKWILTKIDEKCG